MKTKKLFLIIALVVSCAVGKIAEKIMAEDAGDAPEQVDVDILFPEYLVNIGACAA